MGDVRKEAEELRDKLRALVSRMLHVESTFDDLVKEARPLGVVFPWDIGADIEKLRTIVGRISSDEMYTCDQAVADVRALGIEVTDPNTQLARWREAEHECARYKEKYKQQFEASGIVVNAKYVLANGDVVFVQDVRFDLGVEVKLFHPMLNYEAWMPFDLLLKSAPRATAG